MIVYERGEDWSCCLDCAFTWRQGEDRIFVVRRVLRQLAGLKRESDIRIRGLDR